MLFTDTTTLATRGLIPSDSLGEYKGTFGYKLVAADIQLLITVLRNNWARIEGKCGVTTEELDRAERLSHRMLRVVAARAGASGVQGDRGPTRPGFHAFHQLLRRDSAGRIALTVEGIRRGHDRADAEYLVAFSCGSRTLCPSCSTRRMVSTAAHMATKVLPDVAVRQWVLSVPHAIRWLLASNAQVLSAVLRILGLAVALWYETEAKRAGLLEPKTGGLHFPQRFGGSLNVHVHDHAPRTANVVDGAATQKGRYVNS